MTIEGTKEPEKTAPNNIVHDSKDLASGEGIVPQRFPLDYKDEYGTLQKDQALQIYKIPDDDERWEVLDASGGLKKLILKVGHGESPTNGEKVTCHYSGFLRNTGLMFDSSRERGDSFVFKIGIGSVIKGWDKGISTMVVGERAILRCAAEFSYGDKGSKPKVPPNAALDFVVDLEEVQTYEPVWNTNDAEESILKKSVTEVDEGDYPKKLWVVTATYTGRENDEIGRIWCSGKNEKIKIPFDTEFNSSGVIPEYDQPRGFFVCLRDTKLHEQNLFKLKSTDFYTFGSTGSKKFNIAPNTDLFYDITITACEVFKMSPWELDDTEKISKTLELKKIANDYFRRKKFAIAKEIYEEILNIIKSFKEKNENDNDNETVIMISLACHTNTALVEAQFQNYLGALEEIEKGLTIDPKHQKLRYQKASVYFKRGDFALSADVLSELGKEFPENKSIKLLAAKNKRAFKTCKRKTRNLAIKMFGTSATEKLKKEEANNPNNVTKNKSAKKEDDETQQTDKDAVENVKGDKIRDDFVEDEAVMDKQFQHSTIGEE